MNGLTSWFLAALADADDDLDQIAKNIRREIGCSGNFTDDQP